jgi:hypothetical protein
VTLEKHIDGRPVRAYGQGSSQAAAEAQALAGLNGFRKHRYGADTALNKKPATGAAFTADSD